MSKRNYKRERCAICGCRLTQVRDSYARPTPEGRSHRTRHHLVPERFFGRSATRRGDQREGIFEQCPWGYGGKNSHDEFCYECHEELLHNPVLLPEDVVRFADLVRSRGLDEELKPAGRELIAGRIQLLHEVIAVGLAALRAPNKTPPRRGIGIKPGVSTPGQE